MLRKAKVSSLLLSKRQWCIFCRKSSAVTVNNGEYSEHPEYPPILDMSWDARKRREKETWHNYIKALPTVEEKLMELNMPKYYGWWSLILKHDVIRYNALPFVQHITRTHLINKLPDFYQSKEMDEVALSSVEKLMPLVNDAIAFEYNSKNFPEDPHDKRDMFGPNLIDHVNKILIEVLCHDFPHLKMAQVDHRPRVNGFWFAGGIEPDIMRKKTRKGLKWTEEKINEYIDRPIQYHGQPVIQLRCEAPLKPIVNEDVAFDDSLTVPECHYDPRVYGYRYQCQRGTNIPGFWPGDANEFGLISYLTRDALARHVSRYGDSDADNVLCAQAILASFSWLLGQACYQGFTTFNEMTYPLTSQTVVTDGQTWSFFAYQLNTLLVHLDHWKTNPKRNICWRLSDLKLYDRIENGRPVGLNPDVIKMLVKLYANVPERRQNVDMKPYLGEDQIVANIADEEKREKMQKDFKYQYSNIPRPVEREEIYLWEKIYKVDFKTRPMDRRSRFFELFKDPGNRRYDDCKKPYVPKAIRKEKERKEREKYKY